MSRLRSARLQSWADALKNGMDQWEQGVLMAAAILVAAHDQPGMAADVLHELGLGRADCSAMDEFDKQYLRKINGQRANVKLRGLSQKRKQSNTEAQGRRV